MLIIIIYFVQHYKTWNILRNLILWLEMDVINVRVRKKLEWAINRYKKYLNWKIIIMCQIGVRNIGVEKNIEMCHR